MMIMKNNFKKVTLKVNKSFLSEIVCTFQHPFIFVPALGPNSSKPFSFHFFLKRDPTATTN